MKHLLWVGLLLGISPLSAYANPAVKCSNLALAALPVPPGASSLKIGAAKLIHAAKNVPEHCRVFGHVDRDIKFVVQLPTDWNGKLMMEGSGGFSGYLPDLSYDVSLHYAAVGTDLGRSGNPADLLSNG